MATTVLLGQRRAASWISSQTCPSSLPPIPTLNMTPTQRGTILIPILTLTLTPILSLTSILTVSLTPILGGAGELLCIVAQSLFQFLQVVG